MTSPLTAADPRYAAAKVDGRRVMPPSPKPEAVKAADLSTPRDPRYAAAKAEGYRSYDADRAAGRMVPVDRERSACAYAQIATALPEHFETRRQALIALPKPRRLTAVRPILAATLPPEELTEAAHRMAGGVL